MIYLKKQKIYCNINMFPHFSHNYNILWMCKHNAFALHCSTYFASSYIVSTILVDFSIYNLQQRKSVSSQHIAYHTIIHITNSTKKDDLTDIQFAHEVIILSSNVRLHVLSINKQNNSKGLRVIVDATMKCLHEGTLYGTNLEET